MCYYFLVIDFVIVFVNLKVIVLIEDGVIMGLVYVLKLIYSV